MSTEPTTLDEALTQYEEAVRYHERVYEKEQFDDMVVKRNAVIEIAKGGVGPDVRAIARVAHEVNRSYCEQIGDPSQVPWGDAPDWQKVSAVAGVDAILSGKTNSPEQQHHAWCEHKKAEGWVYGPMKDLVKKTHPCLVPYSSLPKEQQVKDVLFRAVVLSMVVVN